MSKKGLPTRVKLTIVGDGASGKTCLLIVFKDESFPHDYVPTVFENYVKYLKVDEKLIELVLWDTAGQEDYDRIRPLSYPSTDVILLCYSIDCQESFQNIPTKWSEELKWYCPKAPVILVGLKKDLRANNNADNADQVSKDFVSREEGQKMADTIGATTFFECSSLRREGVKEVFVSAVNAAMKRKKKMKNRLRKLICFTTL